MDINSIMEWEQAENEWFAERDEECSCYAIDVDRVDASCCELHGRAA